MPQPESTADGKPKFRVIPAGKLHPAIRPRPDDELRFDKRQSLNRLCDIGDWRAGRVDELMCELGFGPRIFRKAWEEASCLDGFERLGVVKPEATILSVGAGTERSLYWLANRVERVHATDLYESSWGFGESEDLNHLMRSAAPFAYRE
ncbi:MAG: hypothetical protein JO152_07815, partial [Mycobacteriaceae bacterium]|nr:hypothetical protein [Mycobacteriaceae bacterium]